MAMRPPPKPVNKPVVKPATVPTPVKRPILGQPGYAGTTGGPKPAPTRSTPLPPAGDVPLRSDQLDGGPSLPTVPTRSTPLPPAVGKPGTTGPGGLKRDVGYGNGVGYDGKPTVPTRSTPLPPAVGKPGTTGPLPTPTNATPTRSTPLPGVQPLSGGLGATIQSADFGGINGGPTQSVPMKKGGRVKAKAKAKAKSSYSSGGKVSSASKRGDGCAQRGKTKGRMV